VDQLKEAAESSSLWFWMVPFVVDVFVIRMGPDVAKFIERTKEKQQRCYHCAKDH